jgi:hypothetical protein
MQQFLFLLLAGMFIFGCSDNSSTSDGVSSSTDKSSSSEHSDVSGSGNSSSSAVLSDSSSSSGLGEASSSSTETTVNVSSSSSTAPVAGVWPELREGQDGVGKGWASRYWDGCKPHCSQRDNVDTTATPFTICRNCDENNNEIPAFTLSPAVNEWWTGYAGTPNSCTDNPGIAYTCFDMAPIKLTDSLAYAFAAAPGVEAACGQCFQLQFDGGSHYDVKEAHGLIKGKTLIILASNIGHDVEPGQFDILVPGGGVGNFNSFSDQIGVAEAELGNRGGGILRDCQDGSLFGLGWDAPAAAHQECVRTRCRAVFKGEKYKDLLNGCLWLADWYMAADNPTYLYKKVECPDYLTQKYLSTINTSKHTDTPSSAYYP